MKNSDTPIRTKRARKLRRKSTSEEVLLWEKLRDRKFMGLKFRRQQPVGPYIVDFYCHEKLLIIELDGGHHSNEIKRSYDVLRTEYLEFFAYKIIRFWNHQVVRDIDSVLEQMAEQIT